MAEKIKDAPLTTVDANLRIPVGNVGDDLPHTITPALIKSWILDALSGGITWNDITNAPQFVQASQVATINGQSILNGNNLHVAADTISWNHVTGKPTIPTKTSELQNDSNFITQTYADNHYNEKLISGTNLAYINGYDLQSGGNIVISATPSYTDTTDSTASVTVTIEGNQVVRLTNANITDITFVFGNDYLSGDQRELTSTIYFTCPSSTPAFSFPLGAHTYGDFSDLIQGVQYIISVQGDNFILTPSQVNTAPNVVPLSGTDVGGGIFELQINDLQPNTHYICKDCTRVYVNSMAPNAGTSSQATRIYMMYPDTMQNPEQVMQIELPQYFRVIGDNGLMMQFAQGQGFEPFYIEIANDFVTQFGINP